MLISYFISVFLHVSFAALWLGGTVLIIVGYHSRNMLTEPQNEDLSSENSLLLSYRTLVWFSFFVLSITGLYNLFVRGYSWYDLIGAEFWRGYFGETLAVKLILFCGVLTGQAVIHFYIGKLATGNNHHTPDKILSFKQRSRRVLYFTLALGLGVLFCAIMLVRGRPL